MAWASDSFFSEHGDGNDVPPGPLASTVQQVISTQRTLAAVLQTLTDRQYCQKPVGLVPSSIGGHVRHCLDHVAALLVAVPAGQLNYDERQRGTEVELSRPAAFVEIERQETELQRLSGLSPQLPLQLTALLSPALPPMTVNTTLGRELAFVLSHTVHHSALVAVIVKLLGQSVPDRFGYAPATIAHLEQVPCVR